MDQKAKSSQIKNLSVAFKFQKRLQKHIELVEEFDKKSFII